MKARLTQSYLGSIKATGRAFWITDEGCSNLRLFIGASGIKTLYVSFWRNEKKQSHKLGSADVLAVAEARVMARDFLACLARGETPDKKVKQKLQLGEFIETYYRPWVETNRKSGKETMATLRAAFQFLFKKPIDELNISELENWRMIRQKEGKKASTINRQVTALNAVLNWGVSQGHFESNPLSRLKRLQERDSNKKTRFLTDDERARLLAAMDEREAQLRAGRENHNEWLSARSKELYPTLDNGFADYLKPLVLIAMNTGIRKGDLLALKWGDIDFGTKIISFVPGKTDSSGEMQHIPMNETVIDTLTTWRQQSDDTSSMALIFPSSKKKGAQIVSIKRSWGTLLKAAQIENFRWHDLRHDFASQLVSFGTDLNTVRELLGHADIKMTLRYAHLAPENKLKAVELLDATK